MPTKNEITVGKFTFNPERVEKAIAGVYNLRQAVNAWTGINLAEWDALLEDL